MVPWLKAETTPDELSKIANMSKKFMEKAPVCLTIIFLAIAMLVFNLNVFMSILFGVVGLVVGLVVSESLESLKTRSDNDTDKSKPASSNPLYLLAAIAISICLMFLISQVPGCSTSTSSSSHVTTDEEFKEKYGITLKEYERDYKPYYDAYQDMKNSR